MGIWIRSQDKEQLVYVDNFYRSINNDIRYYIHKGIEEPDTHFRCSGWLGHYESTERALEVLDEIQNYINSDVYFNLNVFEMPEE